MASPATPTYADTKGAGGRFRRVAWLALGLFCVAFAGLEVVNHGAGAAVAAGVFALAPDLAVLRGVRASRWAPGFRTTMHRPWLPLLVLVGYTVSPLTWVPIFAAGLGWLGHIAFHRAAGDRFGRTEPTGRP